MAKYIFFDKTEVPFKRMIVLPILQLALVIFFSYQGYKSEGTELFSFTSLFVLIIILMLLMVIWLESRITHTVEILNNTIDISTQIINEKILLVDIFEIKYFTMSTSGDSYFWIKKKKNSVLGKLHFFYIPYNSIESEEKLSKLIQELKTYISVKEILTIRLNSSVSKDKSVPYK